MNRAAGPGEGNGRCPRAGAVVALSAWFGLALAGCGSTHKIAQPAQIVEDAHAGSDVLAIAPDSATGASGGHGGRVRLWRLPGGTPLASWMAHAGAVTGLMFLPDGRHLLSTGWDGHVQVRDLAGRRIREWHTDRPIASFAPGADRTTVLLGRADGRVEWWSVDGDLKQAWQPGDARISAVAADGATRQFAASDSRGRVWRWRAGDRPRPLQRPPSYARSLAFDPRDGALLGSGWFKLYRWPARAPHLDELPTGHRGVINDLQFGPDGRYVASISRVTDSAVLLLDPRDGTTLRTFRKHALCGRRVAVSPDGRVMMSSSDDASMRFYELHPRP